VVAITIGSQSNVNSVRKRVSDWKCYRESLPGERGDRKDQRRWLPRGASEPEG